MITKTPAGGALRCGVRLLSGLALALLWGWPITARAQLPTLVKEINPTDNSIDVSNEGAALGNNFYFYADDGVHGLDLWKTDGTPDGTSMVVNLPYSNMFPGFLRKANGSLYFILWSADWHSLFKSDGTAAGTVKLNDFTTFALFPPCYLGELDGNLLFLVITQDRRETLWKTDGTPAGTVPIKEIAYGLLHEEPPARILNGALYFTVPKSPSPELWKTDGTAAGTVSLGNVNNPLAVLNGSIYYRKNSELWRTDGATSVLACNDPALGSDFTPLDFFTDSLLLCGSRLWRFDGATLAEVPNSSGLSFGNNWVQHWVRCNDKLFFVAENPAQGKELWVFDKTSGQASMVKDIRPGTGGSDPGDFIVANGILFFTAYDGVHGRETWRSDGTEGGTMMVADLAPNASSSFAWLLGVGGNLLFLGASSAPNPGYNRELWSLDTTAPVPVEMSRFSAD